MTYDVYLGTSAALVAAADHDSDEFMGNVATATYDPTLAYFTQYFWRIDAVEGGVTSTGDVWTFTTEFDPAIMPEGACGAYSPAFTVDYNSGRRR